MISPVQSRDRKDSPV